MTAETEVGDEPTAVYRFFDAADALLYIGVTASPQTRFTQHAATKPWWPQVARKTVEWHGKRQDAEDAESIAIDTEHPAHNITKPSCAAERTARRAARNGEKHKNYMVGWWASTALADRLSAFVARSSRTKTDVLNEALSAYLDQHETAEPA